MNIFSLIRSSIALIVLLTAVSSALATVYYSKEEALKLAFAEDVGVEVLSLFPTPEQVTEIERLAKVKLDSSLISLHVGKKQGQIVGYALIESHTVRTQPETLLLVLNPDGRLRNVYTLAFHEPAEYQPPERWFALLTNRSLEDLSFDKEVQAVAGATLSSRAALNSARKLVAIFEVLLKPAKP